MLHLHELTKAVQADRDREIRERLPRAVGVASGSRHPEVPDGGVVERGPSRVELRLEPKGAFGA